MPSYSWNPGYSAADSEPLRRRAFAGHEIPALRLKAVRLLGDGGFLDDVEAKTCFEDSRE